MQVQNDNARFAVRACRTLPINELDGFLAITEDVENVFLRMLVQGVTQQKHVRGIVFHHYYLRGTRIFLAQFTSSLWKNTVNRPRYSPLDAEHSGLLQGSE